MSSTTQPKRRLISAVIPRRTIGLAIGAAGVVLSCSVLIASSAISVQAQSGGKGKQAAAMPAPKRVVLFPPDTKGGVSDQIADTITDVAKSRLALSGDWQAMSFLSGIPTVRKALLDGSVSQSEVSKPTVSDSTIKKLTELSGEEHALIFSVDNYEYDAAKNQVNLVMSVRLLDFTGGKPRGAAESASSPAGAPATHKEYDIASDLARALTEKLMTTLVGAPKATPATTTTKKHH